MKQALCMWAGLCLLAAPVARAQEEAAPAGDLTDPIEILKKADAAAKAVKAVRYHARIEYEGSYAKQAANLEGKLLFEGPFGQIWPAKFRFECKMGQPGSDEVREFTVGHDGTNFYFIDPVNKTVHQDTIATVIGGSGMRVIRSVPMVEFVHSAPFSDELGGDKVELQGTEKIGDQECYKVYVQYAKSQGEAIWYFSKKDFLPRQVERMAKDRAGLMRNTVTELEVDPELPPDAYKAVVPEGFTENTTSAR